MINFLMNLLVTQDQYDVIDLSDNDIKKLDNFPPMRRLSAILANNNSISKISPTLGETLPNLQAVILTNNRVSNLFEIDHLAGAPTLEVLSLMENPVTLKPNYRLFCIYRIPSLKTLDFSKVTRTEREEAKKLFKSSSGKAFLTLVEQEKQQLTGSSTQRNGQEPKKSAIMELTDAQKEQVKRAIERASTKEEVDAIEAQLQVLLLYRRLCSLSPAHRCLLLLYDAGGNISFRNRSGGAVATSSRRRRSGGSTCSSSSSGRHGLGLDSNGSLL